MGAADCARTHATRARVQAHHVMHLIYDPMHLPAQSLLSQYIIPCTPMHTCCASTRTSKQASLIPPTKVVG